MHVLNKFTLKEGSVKLMVISIIFITDNRNVAKPNPECIVLILLKTCKTNSCYMAEISSVAFTVEHKDAYYEINTSSVNPMHANASVPFKHVQCICIKTGQGSCLSFYKKLVPAKNINQLLYALTV